VTFAAFDLLAGIITTNTRNSGGFDTLAINTACCWFSFTPNPYSFLVSKDLIDGLSGTIFFPFMVVIGYAAWCRILLGYIRPLAAGSGQIKYPVHNGSHIKFQWSSGAPSLKRQ